ncbi:MAG: hypothetical protein C5B47_02400 [Verrucomicrobia bacterium]|nr:MAG: hypothetical protein C5B47_02400 [Verrucomicrobiota bacterium]
MNIYTLLNPHALDRLFDLIHKIAHPSLKTELLVSGADHGAAVEKISRYRFGQTFTILKISASRYSPVSKLCQKLAMKGTFLNVGCAEKRPHPQINDAYYFGKGTDNICNAPAMERSTLSDIFKAADCYLAKASASQICLGEVGVGNTLASSAIVSLLCNKKASEITGAGSGISLDIQRKKIGLIERAIDRHRSQFSQTDDPLNILSSLGGFEIAWNVGIILAAHKYKKRILLDGFITGCAALIAATYQHGAVHSLVATHVSREPGHRDLLQTLHLQPFLTLDMALGQGFGAVLGYSFILNTASLLRNDNNF